MTMITATGIVAQYNGDDVSFAGTATLEVFARNSEWAYSYMYPDLDIYDVTILSSEYYSVTINGQSWDEIAFVELTFNSGLSATYASFYDIDLDREYMFEMSRDSAAVPDLPSSTSQINNFVNQVSSFDYLLDDPTTMGSIDLAQWSTADSTEDDYIYSTLGYDNLIYSLGVGDDTLYSSAGRDRVFAGEGNDRLVARGDRDEFDIAEEAVFYGEEGNDLLKVKFDRYATFDGGAGNDKLIGAALDDSMVGGSGTDIIIGLAGEDMINGDEDRDFLYGGRDNDQVHGDAGDDEVRGNLGNDTLTGGEGDDDLRGGGGNDDLSGGAGNDFLFGENGRDVLNGGAGDDVMTGGLGGGTGDGQRDTFVYSRAFVEGGGFDRIKDFEDGLDRIDLTESGLTEFSDVFNASRDTSAGMRITFGTGEVLFLEGFSTADFDASDVIL
jgi:Ca2+-binding RTX toxin-like protein